MHESEPMNDRVRDLPPRTWSHIWRVWALVLGGSVAASVILTIFLLNTFSGGINMAGLNISIVMPILLGGPMLFYLILRHEQLCHANQQLELLATTDWLTTCLNRGAFTAQVMHDLVNRDLRSRGTGAALLIIDADDFKQVNDRFGHLQGDAALRLITDAIHANVRTTDLVGRMGGEEFCVYLVDADPGTADQVAERIHMAISCLQFTPKNEIYPLSVSIGGTTFARRTDFTELYRLADQRLYAAKTAGRDCVALMQAA